jgi:YD repeat-containing protein
VRSARPSAVAATALLLLGPCAPLARAQSTSPVDGITPLGLAPGRPAGSFPLSGFESVNLFGGNLSFALPLLRVEGRGEAGFTMHLAVERRWSLRLTNPRKQHGEPDRYAAEWDWGVKPGYSPGTLYQRSATQRVSVDPVSFMVTHQETLTRLSFRRGDGTEHDLRDDLTEGQLKVWWEGKAPFDRGVRWHATDGSAASFVSDAPIRDPGATPLGTRPVVGGRLLLADGTEYRIGTGTGGAPGRVTRIRDRNGNTVRLEYADGALVRVTDPLGRVSTITYRRAGEPWEDEIRYGGYGGADRSVVVRHRRLGECLVEGESLRSYPELFPTLTMADPSAFDPRVACEVELPNGTRYDLAYNAWGELVRVTLPTGGRIEYEWGSGAESEHGLLSLGSGGDGRVWAYAVARRVTSRRVWNYGQLEQWAEYDASECRWGDCRVEVRHLDADGTLVSRERHSFRGSPLASFGLEPCDYPAWTDGQLESVETYDAAGNRLRRVEQTWAQRAGLPWSSPGTLVRGEPPNDVRLVKTVTTLDDDLAHRAVVRYEHDDYNNVTLREERGHGGGVVRRTERTYVAGPYAQEPVHVRDLLAVEDVRDGAGERRSRTVFEYDDYGPGGLLERPGIVGWEDVGRTARGNLTAVRRWLDRPGRSDPSTEALTRRRYDVAGNPWREIDPEGRAVTWHFDDNCGRADGSLGGGVDHRTFARVTLVRDALGHETRTQFDYETGLPVDQRDRTGLVTRLEYDDPLDRLSFVERGANLPDATRRARTGFTYTDGRWRREVLTHEDQWTSGDAERKTRVLYDELGREWQTGRKAPHPQPWIVVDRRYDARGRLSHVSNPWAEGQGEGPAWTLTRYDAIDRPVEVETPDGAVVATAYSGPTVTVTDAAERQRTSTTDALGRVVEVVEYPDGHAPSRTSYTYDALDHLTGVRQGPQQSRSFLYDSLGRLREAGNPESGLVRYEYDRSGLLVWRRDARGVETSHAYDGLGRERHRAYTDGTPAVAFAWDDDPGGVLAASPWSAGRLVSVDNGVSRSEWRHGPHGHVESSLQRTAGRAFRFDYVTDFAGNVLEQRYPSGRVVTTEVDKLDRVVSVVDAAGLALSDVSYAPHGAATSLRLGNGLVETTRFNLRLQPERVAVGSPTSRLPLLSLDYRYWPEGAPAQRNDGNVWLQRVGVAVPRMELATHTVRYGYDGTNRLASASEEGSWSQHYRYDRWGNRGGDRRRARAGPHPPRPRDGLRPRHEPPAAGLGRLRRRRQPRHRPARPLDHLRRREPPDRLRGGAGDGRTAPRHELRLRRRGPAGPLPRPPGPDPLRLRRPGPPGRGVLRHRAAALRHPLPHPRPPGQRPDRHRPVGPGRLPPRLPPLRGGGPPRLRRPRRHGRLRPARAGPAPPLHRQGARRRERPRLLRRPVSLRRPGALHRGGPGERGGTAPRAAVVERLRVRPQQPAAVRGPGRRGRGDRLGRGQHRHGRRLPREQRQGGQHRRRRSRRRRRDRGRRGRGRAIRPRWCRRDHQGRSSGRQGRGRRASRGQGGGRGEGRGQSGGRGERCGEVRSQSRRKTWRRGPSWKGGRGDS